MLSKMYVVSLMYILVYGNNIAMGLLLSPSKEVVICDGEQLELTCTTNVSILQWTSSPLQTEQRRVQTFSRSISTVGESQQVSTMVVNSTLFSVSRVSCQDELPLMSRLVISPVSRGLNGTKVNCTERAMNNENTSMASTTINVVGNILIPNYLNINVSVVKYGTNDVTVLLTWMPEKGVTYHVSTEPETSVSIIAKSSGQLIVPYNTCYNVNIEAISCGQNSISTTFEIYYESCGIPVTHNSVHYLSYNSTLEGLTVIFQCTDITKEFTSVCLKNASWIPDPVRLCTALSLRLADCGPPPPARNGHIVPHSSTLEGAEVTYTCWNVQQEENTSQCIEIYTTAICSAKGKWEPKSDMCSIFSERSFEALSQEGRIAIASSVAVFAVTSILFFVVGYLSGHFCYKKRKVAETASPTEQAQTPYYDDVVLKQQKEQELELKENVAYAQPVLSQINN